MVPLTITYKRQKHSLKMAVSPHLSHPVILGTDWTGFRELAADLGLTGSQLVAQCEVCAALATNAILGTLQQDGRLI